MKRVIGHGGKLKFGNNDYLVFSNGFTVHVFGKNELIVSTMSKIRTWIISGRLIINLYKEINEEYNETWVYDLINGDKIGSYIFYIKCIGNIFESSNGSVLAYVPFDNIKKNLMSLWKFNSYNDFIDFALGKTIGTEVIEPILDNYIKITFICTNNFLNIYFLTQDCMRLTIGINEQSNIYNITKNDIIMTKNTIIVRNVVYMWNDDVILIFDNGHITIIKNHFKVQIYSNYYDVFIDCKFRKFRICDGKLTPYKFNYDYWRDFDKPEIIQFMIDMLIDLDLFPLEIYNELYHAFVIINNCTIS